MNELDIARRVVGAAYVRRNARPITLGHLERLERANAALSTHVLVNRILVRDGRYVIGMAIVGTLVSLALAVGVYWTGYTLEGSCFRASLVGARNGQSFAATSAACKSHNFDSILSGRPAIASAPSRVERR